MGRFSSRSLLEFGHLGLCRCKGILEFFNFSLEGFILCLEGLILCLEGINLFLGLAFHLRCYLCRIISDRLNLAIHNLDDLSILCGIITILCRDILTILFDEDGITLLEVFLSVIEKITLVCGNLAHFL